MARITLTQINRELESKGWKILSKKYQNLKTQMTFMCDEGHKVYTTWGQLRKKLFCPSCQANQYKNMAKEIDPKLKGVTRILALDQSTWDSGWSVFDGGSLTRYGTFTATEKDESKRFVEIKEWFLSMYHNFEPDVVAIEGIQYQKNFGVTTFQILARLQGVIMATCAELGVSLEVCPTNTWRSHIGVKGRSRVDKKTSMKLIVKEKFDITVNDDCADAIGIGKYAADIFSPDIEIEEWE